MNKINFKNPSELLKHAAEQFFSQGQKTLEKKPFFDVALSGGSTAQGFFPYLLSGDQNILEKTRWFFSDERAVDLNSEHSNAGQAWRLLIDPLKLQRAQFFPMFSSDEMAANAASNYETLLKTVLPLNAEGIPVFDLIYLGMGLDGHTASLFPESDLLTNLANEPALVRATREAKLEHERITMMPRLILAAEEICLLTTGQEKSSLVERILLSAYQPELWPVQLIIQNPHPRLNILATN